MSSADANGPETSVSGVMKVLTRMRDRSSGAKAKPEAPVAQTSDEHAQGSADRWPLPGLAPMTRVRTSFGDVHAVALRKGDLVQTRGGDFKPIVWLNRIMLDQRFLDEKADSNPIRIQAGAVGSAVPTTDIMVSPRQVVCPSPMSNIKKRHEASELVSKAGVARQRETGLSYTMFHLGDPEEIYCDGVYLLFEPLRNAA